MGKKKEKKMGDLLSELKEIEGDLAHEEKIAEKETYGNFSEFPEGHPVRSAIDEKLGNKERMNMATNQANELPVEEEEEKLDYSIEELIQSIKDGNEKKITKPKKVISRKIAEQKKQAEREENIQKVKSICDDVNSNINNLITEITNFRKKVKACQHDLQDTGFSTAKYVKLERFSTSFCNLLNESKVNTKRLL